LRVFGSADAKHMRETKKYREYHWKISWEENSDEIGE
jgi:hypothetical protein